MKASLFVLVFLFLLFSSEVNAQTNIANFDLHKRIGFQINIPFDLGIDSKGDIYVCDGSVIKFSPEGHVYHNFTLEGITSYGNVKIAIDLQDNIYLVSENRSKVAKFNKEGKLLFEFGAKGIDPGQFMYPEGIAVNSKGEFFVADTWNKRIQKFDQDGKFLQIISVDNSATFSPSSLDFDADDNLYVLDKSKPIVLKFSPAGELIKGFGNSGPDTTRLAHTINLAVNKITGQVFVTHSMEDGYFVYSTNGDFEYKVINTKGTGRWPYIAINKDGNIVVIEDGYYKRVVLLSKTGEILKKWGDYWSPFGLTMDIENNVYMLTGGKDGIIVKFNPSGEVVKDFHIENIFSQPIAITSDLFGNIYVLDSPDFSDNKAVYVFDSYGKLKRQLKILEFLSRHNKLTDIAVDRDGNMFISNYYGSLIYKLNSSGQKTEFIGRKGYEAGEIFLPRAVAVDHKGIIHVLDYNGERIQQFAPDGKFIREFGSFTRNNPSTTDSDFDFAVDGKGTTYVSSQHFGFKLYNAEGELLYEALNRPMKNIAVNNQGTRLIVNEFRSDAFSIYLTDDYKEPQSVIKGFAYADGNKNCLYDEGEQAVPGLVIEATPGPYYTTTREDGSYTIAIDTGTYTLGTMIPTQGGRLITPTCPLPAQGHTVKVAAPGQVVENVNFGNTVLDSPYLSVSVSSTRRRRCFPSTTTLTYSNTGFAPVTNAKVYLQLPEYVVLKSANKPYIRLPNGTYAFEAGTLAEGQYGTITIQDSVVCGNESIRGLTVCTKAWITPGNQTTGGKAITTVTGVCNYATGHIRFVIRNTGQGDMESESQFRIYQDGQLSTVEGYQLAAGDSMVLHIPASGRTVRLEADQPDGNGDNTLASATVEACREIASRVAVSTNFVNAFPTDDEEAEVAEECLPIIDSYDPNDKLVLPTGLTEENFTPTGTALKYKIRFQNTGTDVAYRVVVVDTLSQHLDISTLQIGAASHNYTFAVSGKGQPVLTWTFNNIMLPDSTSNELGSHGYIQFSIKPKAELPEKTAVENFADIFFDYNSPIRTNVTVNRIYDMPQEIKEENRIIAEEVIMTPAIANFTPAAGRFGAEVIITGAKFSGNAQDNKVYFNGKLAEILEGDAASLKVKVPAGASTGTLKVITANGGANSSAAFTVYQPPVVSSFSPAEGIVGSEVVLQGSYLPQELLEQVKLGSHTCEVIRNSENEITVKVPAGAVSGAFTLHTKGGTAVSSGMYKVWYAPAITSTDTAMQRIGGKVSLYGVNFASEAPRNLVQFGSMQAQVLQAGEQLLQVRVPEGAQTGTLSVTTPGGTASRAFEVIPAPLIAAVHPARASVGSVVELEGQHFLTLGKQDTVSFSGMEAVILSSSATSLKVRVPRGAATGKVMVAGSGGRAVADFEVEPLAPQQAIEVYPNPSSGRVTIDFVKADFDVHAVQVFDVRGRLVHDQMLSSGLSDKLEIDLSAHTAGVYLVSIRTERGMVVKRVALL